MGNQIRTFEIGVEKSGAKSYIWDGTNNSGELVGAGIYLFQIQAGDFTKSRKMIFLK